MVNTRLEVLHLFTGPLRGQGESKDLTFPKDVHHGIHRIGIFGTVHRGPARPSKKPAKGILEQALLADIVDLLVQNLTHQKSQDEIQPMGMGHHNDHTLVKRGKFALELPAQQFEVDEFGQCVHASPPSPRGRAMVSYIFRNMEPKVRASICLRQSLPRAFSHRASRPMETFTMISMSSWESSAHMPWGSSIPCFWAIFSNRATPSG